MYKIDCKYQVYKVSKYGAQDANKQQILQKLSLTALDRCTNSAF